MLYPRSELFQKMTLLLERARVEGTAVRPRYFARQLMVALPSSLAGLDETQIAHLVSERAAFNLLPIEVDG
jgi:hypothetical protein